jgi:very-short-patch-repair endonuclease
MTRYDVDRAIDGIARRQHGAFNRTQAERVGAGPGLIKRRLAAGDWVGLDNAVYALPSHRGTWLRQAMAATLGERHASLSGPSGAALHDFPHFRRARLQITVPVGSHHLSRLAIVRQSDRVETTRVEGIRVVTTAQAAIEVARYLDVAELGRLVDDVGARDRRFLPALEERFVDLAYSRWPGIGRMRAVLAERGDGYVPPESEIEAILWDVMMRAFAVAGEVPTMIRQAGFPWWPAGGGRVDVLVPDWRMIVEADGRRWHTRVRDFEVDRWRDNEAIAHGYRPLRFTWYRLTQRVPEVIDQLRRMARRAREERPLAA